MRRFSIAFGSVLMFACSVGKAQGAEYCVSCYGPEAYYRCAIESEVDVRGGDPRNQLLCITQLAQNGGHESCSVMRQQVDPCDSAVVVLVAPPAGGPPVLPDDPLNQRPEYQTNPPMDQAEGGTPETVQELAGQTYQSSKKGLKKAGKAITGTAEKTGEAVSGAAKKTGEAVGNAGSAVGNAAKKTWNCLKSLFSDC
jgi:hypothetical protein